MTCKYCGHLMIKEIRPQIIYIIDDSNHSRYKQSSFLQEGLWCTHCDEEIIRDEFYSNREEIIEKLNTIEWSIKNEKI